MPQKQRRAPAGKASSTSLLTPDFPRPDRQPTAGEVFRREDVAIHFQRAEQLYAEWPSPTCIISDGPYGVNGFPGDEREWASLDDWYEPHIRAWSQAATPQTTLWFWSTEVGWATVHPVLAKHG